jgi:hypothetical protein
MEASWVKTSLPHIQVEQGVPSQSPDEWREQSSAIRQALLEIQAIEREATRRANSIPRIVPASRDE